MASGSAATGSSAGGKTTLLYATKGDRKQETHATTAVASASYSLGAFVVVGLIVLVGFFAYRSYKTNPERQPLLI